MHSPRDHRRPPGGRLVGCTGRLEVGGVVAFISAITRLNDPWGDLVNYFRDLSGTQVKYRLLSEAVSRLVQHEQPAPDPADKAIGD